MLRLSNVALVVAASLAVPVLQAAEEDPWEGVNRVVFRFNDTLDTLKPLAQGYQKVTPTFEDGISNVFRNLDDVVVLTNGLRPGQLPRLQA
ncbi:hypothetical protein SSTU70S_03460 [Stutzerimonas stutzeri]